MIIRKLAPPAHVASLSVMHAFECIKRLPYPLLLDSATASPPGATPGSTQGSAQASAPVARYSFAMADPQFVVKAWGNTVEITDSRDGTIVRKEGRALEIAKALLADESATTPAAPLPPFQGGIAGYIGYEYGGVLERLPKPHIRDIDIPDVVLGLYRWVIAWDHDLDTAWILGQDDAENMVDQVCASLQTPLSPHDSATLSSSVERKIDTLQPHQTTRPTSQVTQAEYEAAVTRVQEYIRAGDIFQANLSQRFSAPFSGDPWALYRSLRAINPAPFAAYFDVETAVIVSASPERFLHVSDSGVVETRPIKGTLPRGETKAEDEENSIQLLRSDKDAAEHVMIVDVLRNDISRVCTYGSVQVPQLKVLESHPTVHHLVSTITGQLRPDATAVDLLHASFPGGSITGAPKVRAMEIIAELEPTARNVYCGSIGYVSTTGAMDSSIVIRTFTVKDGTAYFSVGGGIVADSVPAAEYQETLDKGHALMSALDAMANITRK